MVVRVLGWSAILNLVGCRSVQGPEGEAWGHQIIIRVLVRGAFGLHMQCSGSHMVGLELRSGTCLACALGLFYLPTLRDLAFINWTGAECPRLCVLWCLGRVFCGLCSL